MSITHEEREAQIRADVWIVVVVIGFYVALVLGLAWLIWATV